MSQLDKATSARNGISLDNLTGLFSFAGDPSSLGFDAPLGSLILATDGKLWLKKTAPTTGWEEIITGGTGVPPHKDTHVSGGSDAFTSTDFLEAVVARLRESGGPTDLLMGAVPDDHLLVRAGATIVGIDYSIGIIAPSVDVQEVSPAAGVATTSLVFIDLPGASFITLAGATRDYIVNFTGTAFVNKANKSINIRFVVGGVVDSNSQRQIDAPSANAFITIATTHAGAIPPGAEVKIQWAVAGGGGAQVELGNSTLNALGVEV
jgi:hypothetical protein